MLSAATQRYEAEPCEFPIGGGPAPMGKIGRALLRSHPRCFISSSPTMLHIISLRHRGDSAFMVITAKIRHCRCKVFCGTLHLQPIRLRDIGAGLRRQGTVFRRCEAVRRAATPIVLRDVTKRVTGANSANLGIIPTLWRRRHDGNTQAETAGTACLVQGRRQESAGLRKRATLGNSNGEKAAPHSRRRCAESDGARNQVPVH